MNDRSIIRNSSRSILMMMVFYLFSLLFFSAVISGCRNSKQVKVFPPANFQPQGRVAITLGLKYSHGVKEIVTERIALNNGRTQPSIDALDDLNVITGLLKRNPDIIVHLEGEKADQTMISGYLVRSGVSPLKFY